MCGVVGVLDADGGVADLCPALAVMRDRGPDGTGSWSAPGVTLGHTRLATRGGASGAQPLRGSEVVAVVNGELYDVAPLRAELCARGHRFTTESDCELIVHGWRAWGAGLLPRLRGEFAFVLWDERERELIAARDRFGVKPLAWSQHDGRLLLASNAKALLALGVTPRWDETTWQRMLCMQYAPIGRTIFQGIQQLPAGHLLRAQGSQVQIERWWTLELPTVRPARDPREAADALRERLDDAVRVRLEADVPIAFQLSGGLDSSAVLAAARHATTAPLSAFCVAFRDASEEGAHYNKIEAAAEIAEHCGARLHTVEVDDAQIAEHFAPAVIAAEGPAINAHAAAKLLLSRSMRAHGYVVALTGEGADEVLWGYPHLVVDAGQRPRGAHAASRGLMLPSEDTASEGTPTWLRAKIALGALLAPLLRAPILCDPRAVIASEIEPSLLRCRSPEQIGALTWSSYALEGYILRTLGDPLELAHGIEGRVPFLDHHLFDLARSLPTELLIREGVSKWLLREAARLPQVHRAREKHPFVAPPLGPRSLCRIRELVEDPSFLDQPMFAPQRVRDLLAKYIHFDATARKRYDPALWMIASLAILQQHYGLRT